MMYALLSLQMLIVYIYLMNSESRIKVNLVVFAHFHKIIILAKSHIIMWLVCLFHL